MEKKYIVVACGSGIATSNMVAGLLRDYCKEQGIDVNIHTCTIMDLEFEAKGADLIVTTSRFSRDFDAPVVNGVPLISGIGKEDTLNKIIDLLTVEN